MPTDHAFLESIDLFAELDPQMRKSIAAHFETLRITGGLPSCKTGQPFETGQRFAMRTEGIGKK
ncbi:MAG: hypothetical protein WAK57_10080 [Desulfobacterales bacterium]